MAERRVFRPVVMNLDGGYYEIHRGAVYFRGKDKVLRRIRDGDPRLGRVAEELKIRLGKAREAEERERARRQRWTYRLGRWLARLRKGETADGT